jgi:hypothetical protein
MTEERSAEPRITAKEAEDLLDTLLSPEFLATLCLVCNKPVNAHSVEQLTECNQRLTAGDYEACDD